MVSQSLAAEARRWNMQLGLTWHLPCSLECAHCTHHNELWASGDAGTGPSAVPSPVLLLFGCSDHIFPQPQAAPANFATRSFMPRPVSPPVCYMFSVEYAWVKRKNYMSQKCPWVKFGKWCNKIQKILWGFSALALPKRRMQNGHLFLISIFYLVSNFIDSNMFYFHTYFRVWFSAR